MRRRTLLALPLLAHAAQSPRYRVQELRRVPAPEAHQAVAAGPDHLYAIGNHVVAQYRKDTFERTAIWECETGRPLIHLNSGIVRDGLLHCAHSNYPAVPMTSSIETWDAATLRHVRTHSFGIEAGSATWIDLHRGRRYVTFAHYSNRAAEPNRDPRWTLLVEYDNEWRRLQSWTYPPELIARQGNYSISGGVFLPSGHLLCTGHDHPELYLLGFPTGGSTLVLHDTIPAPINGQGIALDPRDPTLLYAIGRTNREFILLRLTSA